MSFLFVWQTLVQRRFPWRRPRLVFAKYAGYLYPFTPMEAKAISGGLVILSCSCLPRIATIGKISIPAVDRRRGNDAVADLGRGYAFQR